VEHEQERRDTYKKGCVVLQLTGSVVHEIGGGNGKSKEVGVLMVFHQFMVLH